MKEEILRKYARLAVCSGINIQKDQPLVISASVKDAQFVHYCVEEAYKAQASRVFVNWDDEELTKLDFENAATEVLSEIPQWAFDKRKYMQDKGAAFLSVTSDTPGLLSHIDPAKIRAVRMASMMKMKPLYEYTMANHGQWCIVALPSVGWAKKVFPDKTDDEAVEALQEAILKSVRIDETNDPVEEWKQHDINLRQRCNVLNQHHFKTLHFENSLGTDLYVGLVQKHVWAGGSCFTDKGVEFNPNMPSEEVFCMPQCDRVDGKVISTKPLSYGGKVIGRFELTFKNGRVEEAKADNDQQTLDDLLNSDEGSRHLGEVALISYQSPISLMNILFYETLFDENASCHLALGAAYPENVEGGTSMSQEELAKEGANDSMNHVDFMFGSEDMKVTGICEDGTEIPVFTNGNFVF